MATMNFDELAQNLTPALYAAFKRAVELRKWPDGTRLDKRQLQICLEAIIKYEREHDFAEEERTGYLDRTRHPAKEDGNEGDEEIKWVQ